MILFTPMWNHEVQRIGLMRCSRAAYALLVTSDYATWLAFALAIASLVYFRWPWLWPAWLCWLGGRLLVLGAWHLLKQRSFHYDAATVTAHWQDADGQGQQYGEADYRREHK